MRLFMKFVAGALLAVVVLAAAVLTFLTMKKPAMRPAEDVRVVSDAATLERGRYLVEHVADCLGCHSDHEWNRWASPVKPGTEGQGGFVFGKNEGVPGVVAAQNITPDAKTGLGEWTDGEIIRAMREGVSRDGEALFPMMPYNDLRTISDEDAQAIVTYLRSLRPVSNATPERRLDFPMNHIVKFMPRPLDGPVAAPDRNSDPVGYGGYLVNMAGCGVCHTPRDEKGKPIASMRFAGGWKMVGPWGAVTTPNITPHPDTYVGRASREEFIGRFKAWASYTAETSPITPSGSNTIMPWLAFSGMTDEDLGLIYDFLQSLDPIEHKVVTWGS